MLKRTGTRLRGFFITHGHEDHIGALPYLLKTVNIPVYGTKLSIGLVECKLKEHGLLGKVKLNVIKPGQKIKLRNFNIEVIHVNHSIPDSVAFAIKTPTGTVIQTGDFKIDTTPIDGDIIDLARFAELGREGVLCLLSDSTNAERPGYTQSERTVGASFENLFRSAGKQQAYSGYVCFKYPQSPTDNRRGFEAWPQGSTVGRSLENAVSIGMNLGYLNVPDGVMIPLDRINSYPPELLVIITTGSQGEPMSALHRMAFSDHRKVEIGPNDCVIISANPIPGNEKNSKCCDQRADEAWSQCYI